MKRFSFLLLFALVTVFMTSCVKDQVERETTYYTESEKNVIAAKLNIPLSEPDDYSVTLPDYVAQFSGGFGLRRNRGKATLGRVLFYDKNLSANKTLSCASCHHQENAFADPIDLSKGFEGKATKRNSYAIGSTASTRLYYDVSRPTLFWDSRARTVSAQSRQTLQDAIEMGMDLDELSDRINSEEHYKILLNKAYHLEAQNGDVQVKADAEKVLECLEEFVLSFSSHGSKFDEGFKGVSATNYDPFKTLNNFNKSENLGKNLFMTNCANCHGTTFTLAAEAEASNGLDKVYSDKGIGALDDKDYTYNGVFKVPILRNLALTPPYMHDGRFANLEEVIEHYSTGIEDHDNLHPFLQEENGEPKRFNFTSEEKTALVDFLNTLTDPVFTTEEKFSDPFIKSVFKNLRV